MEIYEILPGYINVHKMHLTHLIVTREMCIRDRGDAGGNGGIVVTQADSNLCGAAVDVGGNEIVLDALFRSVQQLSLIHI